MNYLKYLKTKSRSMNEVAKKGDLVYFYNDSGDKVQGRVVSVNGGIYTIDYEGDTYQTNDIMYEAVGGYGYSSGAGMSLTDHGSSSDSGASIKGTISDINKKVAAVADMVKSGDIAGAAKLAVAGVFRYGSEFKEKLDSAVSSSEFAAEYAKAHDAYKSGAKDKPKPKDDAKDDKNADQ